MNRRTVVIAASCALLISAVVVLALRSSEPTPANSTVQSMEDGIAQPTEQTTIPKPEPSVLSVDTSVETESVAPTQPEVSESADAPDSDESEPCIPPEDIFAQPVFVEELKRMEPVSIIGSDYEVFLDVDKAGLRSFAEQGNSAAMVLYAMYLSAEAKGEDPERLVAMMTQFSITPSNPGFIAIGGADLREAPANAKALFEESEYWYREAVARGRIMALVLLGEVRSKLGRTIEDLELDLSDEAQAIVEKSGYPASTMMAHMSAVAKLVPNLGNQVSAATSTNEEVQLLNEAVAEALSNQVIEDAAALGLSIPVIPSANPEFAKLESRMCKPGTY
ncbi:MAG: hypothetical protein AAF578_08935 [Pseudomonadota bacterium]